MGQILLGHPDRILAGLGYSHVLSVFTAVRAVGAGGAALVVVLLAQPRLEVAVHLPRRHERPFSGGERERERRKGPQFCQLDLI